MSVRIYGLEHDRRAYAGSIALYSLDEEPEAVLVVLAHAGVYERIDGRVCVRQKVGDPLHVGPPLGKLLRVLHEQEHDLERTPAHDEHHQYPHEHYNCLFVFCCFCFFYKKLSR